MDSLLVNFCLLYVSKHWQCENARPCKIHTSLPSFVSRLRPRDNLFPRTIPTILFWLTHVRLRTQLSTEWYFKFGAIKGIRPWNGVMQLVQVLERRSQILNTENPHIPLVTGVEIIGSNFRRPWHQVDSFYQPSKAWFRLGWRSPT